MERLEFVARVMAAHGAQQRELEVLARMPTGVDRVDQRASAPRDMLRQHDGDEQASLVPAIKACLTPDAYDGLAGLFATGRLCLLTMVPRPGRQHLWSHR